MKAVISYDDDKTTWDDIYKRSYDRKIVDKNFDINNPYYSDYRKRYVAQAKNNPNVEISGETDFNFSSKIGVHRQSKYGIYKEVLESIEDQERKRNALKLLEYCKQSTHEVENYSLMLCNGSLQTVKGSFDMDRIDVFLYLLDNYYKKKDELILSHCSFDAQNDLRNYLNLFLCEDNYKESIYVYCNEIYHISNKELIDDLVKSGRLSLKSPDRIIDYMKLAVRFWCAKSYYYQKVGIRKTRKYDSKKLKMLIGEIES